MRNATAPRPTRATRAPNPGDVGLGAGVGVVGTAVTMVVGWAVGDTVVGVGVGTFSTTLKSAVLVTSTVTPDACTMYSSGLKVVVSTGKDHVL